MKYVLFLISTPLWVLYTIFTGKQRHMHLLAHKKGMECVDLRGGLFSDIATFNPDNPPQKETWITFKQFKFLMLREQPAKRNAEG